MSNKTNFVLIFSDQHRADALGCAGSAFVKTPCLDRLAAEGTRFDQAFTPWPVCTPARASMWTGLYPHAHGIIDNVYGVENAFDMPGAPEKTVFDFLKDEGYTTAHFGKWHLGEGHPPFFDVWEESFNSRKGHWIDGKLDGVYRPDLQTDLSIDFLRRQAKSDTPFVMIQGYYPPHDPYTAPSRFYAHYRDKGVPFAGYYAAVSALDWNVGRIVDTLDETGLRQNTMVIYFSDHGDTFFYRPKGEHKFVCTEDSIRIPMIASMPGTIQAGAVSDLPVGLQDLTPTMLDFAAATPAIQTHGASLRGILQGTQRRAEWRDGFYVQNITHIGSVEQRAWRQDNWKIIASDDGQHELYNLSADPEEELNLFRAPREDPGFNRFKHYESTRELTLRLCDTAAQRAQAIADARGLELFSHARAAAIA